MSGEQLLIVDDDPDLLNMLALNLQGNGFSVLKALDGHEALRQMYDKRPDLIILDIVLPDPKMDGITVCRRIREVSEVPIIMLTAEKDPDFVVKGLEAGADDYITKPYNANVLIARVRANLRRAATEPTFIRSGVVYSDGYLTVNLDERRVLKEGSQIKLSPTEFNMLAKLLESAPRVVSYRDLLEDVWGYEYVDDIDYLRVYVWHLRRKLEKEPKSPVYIVNELGVGYRFERQV